MYSIVFGASGVLFAPYRMVMGCTRLVFGWDPWPLCATGQLASLYRRMWPDGLTPFRGFRHLSTLTGHSKVTNKHLH